MKKRPQPARPCRNPIRAGWMANAMLLCLLPGIIGAAYVWLGGRMAKREEMNAKAREEVRDLEKQIQAVNVHLGAAVRRGDLQMLADRLAPGLKPIPTGPRTGRLIVLPVPEVNESELSTLNTGHH